jgi:hypothetical protein
MGWTINAARPSAIPVVLLLVTLCAKKGSSLNFDLGQTEKQNARSRLDPISARRRHHRLSDVRFQTGARITLPQISRAASGTSSQPEMKSRSPAWSFRHSGADVLALKKTWRIKVEG